MPKIEFKLIPVEVMPNKEEYELKTYLCFKCRYFEDKGLRQIIRYDKNKRFIKERIEIRYFCKKYTEFLVTFYEYCEDFKEKNENDL